MSPGHLLTERDCQESTVPAAPLARETGRERERGERERGMEREMRKREREGERGEVYDVYDAGGVCVPYQ